MLLLLTHWGRVTHICVGELCQHWTAPSHYLNQCWNIANSNFRNKLQWHLKNLVYEMAAICLPGSFEIHWVRQHLVNITVRKWSSTLWPDGRTCFFAHYTTSLSSLCNHIWRYLNSKMLVGSILSSVCLRLSQFSQLSFMLYMGLCVFSLPIYRMIIVKICVLYLVVIIKSEVWPICHCLGLGHETVACAVCLSVLLQVWWA